MAYNINYPVTHIQQFSPMTCWSAALSMMLGSNMTAGPGGASTDSQGGLTANYQNVQTLANAYGLRMAPPATWVVSQIARFLQNGPIVMLGIMPRRHAIVISGLVGDGSPTTEVIVHDPFQPSGNSPTRISYQSLMTGDIFHLPPGTQWAPSEYILYR